MAGELSLSLAADFALSPVVDGFSASQSSGSLAINVASANYTKGIMPIPTVETAIPLGSITNLGYVFVKNASATNFIDVGDESGHLNNHLLPGDAACFRVKHNALFAKSDTAVCNLLFFLLST